MRQGLSKRLIKKACRIEAIFTPQLKGLKNLKESVHDNISVIIGKV